MSSNNHDVKVFSTPSCPWCVKAKEYLGSNNVEFEDVDVSVDQMAAQEMVMASGQMGVPQIWIDDKIVIGFNKIAIDELLEL
jgi:glutaredoxin 3